MGNRPILSGKSTVEVNQDRYEELVAAEERLLILENAIQKCTFYNAEFELFKRLFNLEDDKKILAPENNEGKPPEGENA